MQTSHKILQQAQQQMTIEKYQLHGSIEIKPKTLVVRMACQKNIGSVELDDSIIGTKAEVHNH